MANNRRICVSLPIALIDELGDAYPHTELSPLLTQLLMYAHAAGFLKRLSDVIPADARKRTGRPAGKVVAPPDTTEEIEEFGA